MFAPFRNAAADEEGQEGRIVDLSAQGADAALNDPNVENADQAPAEPTYWLGIQGQPLDSPVLRTHLQLADDVGVVVENVMKDSPAEKAGLRNHDVLINVNGEQITDMTVLQHAVAASNGKPIEVKLIRLAKEMSIEITPEERPANLQVDNLDQLHGDMPMGELQGMLKQLQQNGLGGGVRLFGPGMVLNGQQFGHGEMNLPEGMQVSVTRENNQPATVTIRKGDQEWTVKDGDEEAIKNLPDDVRPIVEQLLANQQPGGGAFQGVFNGNDIQAMLPDNLGNFQLHMNERADALREQAQGINERMLKRIEQLEKQLNQLQEQLDEQGSPDHGNAAADPTKA